MTGTASGRRPFPRRLRDVLGDRFALAYLAVCALLLAGAFVLTVADDSGESLALVIPLLATAPGSLVFVVLPDHVASVLVALAVGALVNAAVIGWCARALRRGGRPGS